MKKETNKTFKHISEDSWMNIRWKTDVQCAAAESIQAEVQMNGVSCDTESHRNTLSCIVAILPMLQLLEAQGFFDIFPRFSCACCLR